LVKISRRFQVGYAKGNGFESLVSQSYSAEGGMDSLLATNDIEEALSLAYIHAVAAAAGYVISLKNFDRDGIDITVEAGGGFRPKIDIQAKASINIAKSDGFWKFPLKRRNYDHLIIQTQTPRILVLLHLPDDQSDWINVDINALVMRNCAYWVCLTGGATTENSSAITVSIPQANTFDVPGLKSLLELSRTGNLK
jgi:hypothetical protein